MKKKKWYLYKCEWCDVVFAVPYHGYERHYCPVCKGERVVEEL